MEIKHQKRIVETKAVEIQPEKYTLELTPDEFHLILVLLGNIMGYTLVRVEADTLYWKMLKHMNVNKQPNEYKGFRTEQGSTFVELDKV